MGGIVQNKAVFIHVPKTGGTAIRHALNIKVGHQVYSHFKTDLPPFMFVRDPLERFKSAYYYLKYNELNNYDKINRKYLMRFKDINDFAENADFLNILHFKKQTDWYSYGMTIGYYESLESDFKDICNKFDLKHKNLIYEKKTVKKDKVQFTSDSIKRIKELYKLDFLFYEN